MIWPNLDLRLGRLLTLPTFSHTHTHQVTKVLHNETLSFFQRFQGFGCRSQAVTSGLLEANCRMEL